MLIITYLQLIFFLKILDINRPSTNIAIKTKVLFL